MLGSRCDNSIHFYLLKAYATIIRIFIVCFIQQINLASQSVLEGLNATLDHRGEVFIPELGMVFPVQIGTRFFACQNPMQQGGGRKGLPKSFLNRFTMVYIRIYVYIRICSTIKKSNCWWL